MPRLLTHLLVVAAVAGPMAFTAASAHSASASGQADARMTLLAVEQAAEGDHMLQRRSLPLPATLAAPTPAQGTPTAPARPYGDKAPVVGGGGHFSWGWCTWFVSTMRFVPWSGNAIDWFRNAGALGFSEGRAPQPGAIMVTRESGWGHVAYVESVDGNGRGWTVSEMNYQAFGVVDRRHISTGQVPLVGFIY
jgi:surface antigen